jgi:hypothetical protein
VGYNNDVKSGEFELKKSEAMILSGWGAGTVRGDILDR